MWLLVMILLNSDVPGFNKTMVLNSYATAQECQAERSRIGFEMAKAP